MGSQGEREGKEMEKLDMGEEQVFQPKSSWRRQSGMDQEVTCESGNTRVKNSPCFHKVLNN